MTYSSHPNFDKELGEFLKKHSQPQNPLFNLQNLLAAHFEKKITILGQPTLVLLTEADGYKIWRIYMAVVGITKKQRPRIFFAETNNSDVIFLCCADHTQNYQTKEEKVLGIVRLKEIIKFMRHLRDS